MAARSDRIAAASAPLDWRRDRVPPREEVDIDAAAPVRLVHHFLSGMLGRPSVVVNVSSVLAFVPSAGVLVYSAAKAFLHTEPA